MDKYKRLFSNTLIFAIGTFGSKLLVFFLMPLYTNVLTDAEYGTSDLLQQSANLLVPLVSFGITDAVSAWTGRCPTVKCSLPAC